MTNTQFVVAAVVVLLLVIPLTIILNPPTRWVSAIWGNRDKKRK